MNQFVDAVVVVIFSASCLPVCSNDLSIESNRLSKKNEHIHALAKKKYENKIVCKHTSKRVKVRKQKKKKKQTKCDRFQTDTHAYSRARTHFK